MQAINRRVINDYRSGGKIEGFDREGSLPIVAIAPRE
jgi:hypothetical protein